VRSCGEPLATDRVAAEALPCREEPLICRVQVFDVNETLLDLAGCR
jgi:hypothetical protein